jgi:hypothetical protein
LFRCNRERGAFYCGSHAVSIEHISAYFPKESVLVRIAIWRVERCRVR